MVTSDGRRDGPPGRRRRPAVGPCGDARPAGPHGQRRDRHVPRWWRRHPPRVRRRPRSLVGRGARRGGRPGRRHRSTADGAGAGRPVRCAVGGRHASVAARPRRRRRRCHVQRPGQGPARRVPRGVNRGRRGRRRAAVRHRDRQAVASGAPRRLGDGRRGVPRSPALPRPASATKRRDRATTSPTGCTTPSRASCSSSRAISTPPRGRSETPRPRSPRRTSGSPDRWRPAAALVPVVAQHRTAVARHERRRRGGCGHRRRSPRPDRSRCPTPRRRAHRPRRAGRAARSADAGARRARRGATDRQRIAVAMARPPGHVRARRLRQQRRGAPAWPRQRAGCARVGPANARRRRAAHVPDALHHARRSREASAGSSAATPSSASTTAHCR